MGSSKTSCDTDFSSVGLGGMLILKVMEDDTEDRQGYSLGSPEYPVLDRMME